MTASQAKYLTHLHTLMNQAFNLDEIHTLCFGLEINLDAIPGDGKTAKTRELILGLARRRRLPELMMMLEAERPNIDWPLIPDNFQIPDTGEWSMTPQPTQTIVHGDIVQGDKVGGDKVAGNKISESTTNFVRFYGQQKVWGDKFNQLFAPLFLIVTQQVSGGQQAEAVSKINQLKAETAKEKYADDEMVAGLVEDIVDLVPGSTESITQLFTDSKIVQSAGPATKYVLKRLNR